MKKILWLLGQVVKVFITYTITFVCMPLVICIYLLAGGKWLVDDGFK